MLKEDSHFTIDLIEVLERFNSLVLDFLVVWVLVGASVFKVRLGCDAYT